MAPKVHLIREIFLLSASFAVLVGGAAISTNQFPVCRVEKIIRNPIQCDSYYQCKHGELIPKMCRDGYHFKLSDHECVENHKKRCQDSAIAIGCPFMWRGLGDKCFSVTEVSPYLDQLEICNAVPSSFLAEIRTVEQLKYVGMWLQEDYGEYFESFYLNAQYDEEKQTWLYQSDLSVVPPQLFATAQIRTDDNDCLAISKELNYKLTAVKCTNSIHALCHKKPMLL